MIKKLICIFLVFSLLNIATTFAMAVPGKPSTPDGPSENLTTKTNYTYTSSASNPTGNRLYYKFSWGDGSTSGWLGPMKPNNTVSGTHQWSSKGTYSVTVTAKDEITEETSTSDSLTVHVTKNKNNAISYTTVAIETVEYQTTILEMEEIEIEQVEVEQVVIEQVDIEQVEIGQVETEQSYQQN